MEKAFVRSKEKRVNSRHTLASEYLTTPPRANGQLTTWCNSTFIFFHKMTIRRYLCLFGSMKSIARHPLFADMKLVIKCISEKDSKLFRKVAPDDAVELTLANKSVVDSWYEDKINNNN
ncbi:hypothetical protein NPIL_200401 [Nephila pilipes]|uniref:Uncharacterized protein n=1 Tax=Nephila pilipes TaxID=299642 RepID=A0A8X6U9E0_NEPPI|nr:hypothetical protein NPIL_200401 [Nephila pilipes]